MILLGELSEKAVFSTWILLSLPHGFYLITLIYKHIKSKFFFLVFLSVSFRKWLIFLFCELTWKMVSILCWQLLSISKHKAVMSSFKTIIGNWIYLFYSPSASQNKMTSRDYSEFSSLSLFLGVHITSFWLFHPGDPSFSSLPASPFRKSLCSLALRFAMSTTHC